MLKITIEVNEAVRTENEAMCGCAVTMEGTTSRPELLATANGLAVCMGKLVKTAPDLSSPLYDHFAESLKKELGVDK